MKRRPSQQVSKEEAIKAVMRDPAVTAYSELIPHSDTGGRPRLYPNWVYTLCNALASETKSAAKALRELGDPATWGLVRDLAGEVFPDDHVPEVPIKWHHFRYVKYRYLSDADVQESYEQRLCEWGAKLAREAGNFSGSAAKSTKTPTEQITTFADGKVVKSLFKTRSDGKDRQSDRRGKRPGRVDADAALYPEGDGDFEWGHKFVPVATQVPDGWVMLAITHCAGTSPKHEADVTVDVLRRLRPLLPGAHFHVHDGAMTGEHYQALLTELATLLINKPRAKKNPKVGGKSVGRRVPSEGLVEVKKLAQPDGTVESLEIYQVDGQLGIRDLREDGQWHFVPLESTRLNVNENKSGDPRRYRAYAGLRLPRDIATRVGKDTVTVRLDETEDDRSRGFRRSSYVRAVSPASASGGAFYRKMRNSSESLNRKIEDSLLRCERARSVGWRRVQADMLGLATLTNALTRARMLDRLAQAA